MDRVARLRGPADYSMPVLEIGAGYSPIVPKSAGWNTHVIDHGNQDELRAKYASMGVNVDAIEVVDTVWRDGALHDAVPTSLHGKFQRLIASHMIEHVPDFAGFLNSVERLLHADGVVALAIPDPRYCFDYFKPHSTTGDVLEAYAIKRTRHSRRTVWNHVAYAVNLDGTGAWGQHPVHEPTLMAPFSEAMGVQRDFRDDSDAPYFDSHAWHFTPAGFALAILELGQLGVIDWRIDSLHGPEGCEFFAFLKRGAERIVDASVLQGRRIMLLREHLAELREQIQFAMLGDLIPRSLAESEAWRTTASGGTQHSLTPLKPSDEGLSSFARLERKLDTISATVEDVQAQLANVARVLTWLSKPLWPIRATWGWLRPRRKTEVTTRDPVQTA